MVSNNRFTNGLKIIYTECFFLISLCRVCRSSVMSYEETGELHLTPPYAVNLTLMHIYMRKVKILMRGYRFVKYKRMLQIIQL